MVKNVLNWFVRNKAAVIVGALATAGAGAGILIANAMTETRNLPAVETDENGNVIVEGNWVETTPTVEESAPAEG